MPKAKYALLPKLLTTDVDPGKTIKLEIYLTGSGIVEKNKLYVNYPTAIIDKEHPGEITSTIRTTMKLSTNQVIRLESGEKCLSKYPCDKFGTVMRLSPGYFLDIPNQQSHSWEMARVMGEMTWDDHPPLLVELNTDKEAPAGDHEIRLALSYASNGDIEIAKDVVKVHITSMIERHELEIIIIGIIGTVAAILALAHF